jgi:protein-L-isoaspartate(D-aspartate) O-methyltransferase
MTIEDCRRFYSEEIRLSGNIQSPALIEAFAHVPREEFLGPGPWEIASPEMRGTSALGGIQISYKRVDDPRQLYHNVIVALDKAADINNGHPGSLACWIDALKLKVGDRAYHLGCGVGYYTAIMAEIVGPDGSITASEGHPDLAARAKKNMSRYPNATVAAADGATFDPGACDAMLINAGVTHPVPLWLDRLRDGGRLVLPLTLAMTPKLGAGFMAKVIRNGNGFSANVLTQVAIYSCTGARDPQLESLVRTAITSGALMKMKSLRRDAHEQSNTCVLHGAGVCLSAAEIA